MEYIVKNCPKCNGELHIPENLKSCICMYCGENITLQEENSDIMPESLEAVETDYQKALESIKDLTDNCEQYMDNFKRSSYAGSFDNYSQLGISVLKPAERYASMSEQNYGKVLEEVTQTFIDSINNRIEEKTKNGLDKLRKSVITDQCRFFLAVYAIPMIRSLNYRISEPLADNIIEKWIKQYPKYSFLKASYTEIQNGFKHRGLCFITTAVCESLNKEDDCYELNAFRSFRDGYMLQSEEGKSLVEEYYQIAPAIVTFINMQPDSNDRYEGLWHEYLSPCLKDIEGKRFKDCEKRYTRMVRDLKKEYHIQD